MKLKYLTAALSAAFLVMFQAPAHAQNTVQANLLKAGTYQCELNQSVSFQSVSDDRGTAVLKWAKKNYTMKAVATTTGAIRYEDKASGLVWLMAANKSMLLNHKRGQRLADDCHA